MSVVSFLLMLLIAGACGFIASSLMGAKRMNIVLLILLGFAGAWLGGWLQGALGLPTLISITAGGKMFPLVWTVLGSVIVIGLFSAFSQH